MNIFNLNGIGSAMGSQQNNSSSERILGKDDFLKMLVTQLNYQDPLNPMESTDFSAQLAQFSSLEQLSNIDETLQASLEANYLLATSINNTMAATIIGKQVRAVGNDVYFDGSNPAPLMFELNHNAKTVTIEILDDSGQVKRTINLDNINEGEHVYEWNGEDDRGNELSEGNYQFRIKASNAEGEEISTRTYITGTITGVRYSDSGPVLILGEQQIKLSDVYEILQL